MRRSLYLLLSMPLLCLGETTAVLDLEKLPSPGQTQVWSPLFQASWDKLKSNHAGKLLRVDPPNPLIIKLEQFSWKKDKVMPPEGYAVYAGPDTAEFAKETAADVKKRFGIELQPSALPQNGQGMAYYGVLARDLNFQKHFFRSRSKPMTFLDRNNQKHVVSFFGTAGRNSQLYGKNVEIIQYYPEKKSFTLSILTDQAGEKIVIHRPEKTTSFQNAFEQIKSAKATPLQGHWGAVDDRRLHKNDILKIPYLKLHNTTDLTTLLDGKRYYESESQPSFIARAYQITQFNLSETGAKIRAQSDMSEPFGGAPTPRKFICDEPFFVFAWRDGARLPYFAAWIDGPDALTPFKSIRQ